MASKKPRPNQLDRDIAEVLAAYGPVITTPSRTNTGRT